MITAIALFFGTLVLAKGPFLAIGILSNAPNFEHRQAVRDSWLKQAPKEEIRWMFFVGNADDEKVNKRIAEEAKKYNDLVIMKDVKESYRGIVAKTRAIFKWAFGGKDVADFLLKCDDDSYVRIPALITQLKHMVIEDPQHGIVYLGNIVWGAHPNRKVGHPCYVSPEAWKPDIFPPYALGCGYVVGGKVGSLIVQNKEVFDQEIPIEDATVGIWMEKIAAKLGRKVNYKRDKRFKPIIQFGRYADDLLWHKLKPKEMKDSWEKFR